MLPKHQRVTKASDFKLILDKGRKYRSKNFLLFVKSTINEQSRFGFIASKKVGNAVKRNRSKRLMREVIKNSFPNFISNVDCVIICFPSLPNQKYQDLVKEFERIAHIAGLKK